MDREPDHESVLPEGAAWPRQQEAGDAAGPVAVLYTGGTFGMTPTARGLVPHAQLREQLGDLVDRLGADSGSAPAWTYHETAQAIDSAELQPHGMGHLADGIRAIAAQQRPAGIVVIHGTDTLAYSASFAAFALADLDLPIVFTGAQVPLALPGSDAPRNFADAFRTARQASITGVRIAFGGRVLPAVRAVKRSSESPDAFATRQGSIAGAAGIDDELRALLRTAEGRPARRIGLVKASPGLTASQLRAVLEDCPAGLVLECYGAGTAPLHSGELTAVLRTAVERGSVIVAVTQCAHGSVDLGRYAVGSALADAGVMSGGDMTSEAALGKLSALLRAGLTGDGLEAALARDLLGERTPSAA